MEAALLLEAADLLGPGGSYRSTLREAGLSFGQLQEDSYQVLFSDLEDEPLDFLEADAE